MHEPKPGVVEQNLPPKSIFVSMTESPSRVEAFSDGVFAIAITLLILEIRVPHGDHDLWAGLRALWPSYIAFLMSFIVILIMWVNHHELLRMVQGVKLSVPVFQRLTPSDRDVRPVPHGGAGAEPRDLRGENGGRLLLRDVRRAGRVLEPVVRDHGARRLVAPGSNRRNRE